MFDHSPLTLSMAEAWQAKTNKAAEILAHAERAPALFKPEYVDQVAEEYARSVLEVARWSGAHI